MNRLRPDFEYHASDLRKPCPMPMFFRQEYPDAVTMGTCKTIGGTAGHAVMETVLLDPSLRPATPEAAAEAWTRQFWYELDKARECGECKVPDLEAEYYIKDEAQNYGLMLCGWWNWWDENGGEIIMVEGEALMVLPGKSKNTPPYRYRGRVDLVYGHEEEGVVELDWKFGRMEKQKVNDQVALDLHFQLAQYALYLRQKETQWTTRHGKVIPGRPEVAGLFLMDDMLPYTKKTTIKVPKYRTDAKRYWLDTCIERAKKRRDEELALEHRNLMERERVGTKNKREETSLANAWTKYKEAVKDPYATLYHMPGDLRGPGFHFTTFSDRQLDAHMDEIMAKAASTRMGLGLYRVRSEQCAFCFHRDLCLGLWKGQTAEEALSTCSAIEED